LGKQVILVQKQHDDAKSRKGNKIFIADPGGDMVD
jgi:hypothetical protein